jgi:hypothetical protein
VLFVLGESASLSLSRLSSLFSLPLFTTTTLQHNTTLHYTCTVVVVDVVFFFVDFRLLPAAQKKKKKENNFSFFFFFLILLPLFLDFDCRRRHPAAVVSAGESLRPLPDASECVRLQQYQQQQRFNGPEKLNNAYTHTRSHQCHTFAKS